MTFRLHKIHHALTILYESITIIGKQKTYTQPGSTTGPPLGGYADCHTPGHFLGEPDMKRYLGGSDVGFAIPGLGVFVGPNLTPDRETGLGGWTAEQIAAAITMGMRPDGRTLAPAMPWSGYSHLTKDDAMAIAAFLRSLQPVSHKVSGPFGPAETPTVLVMSVQPGEIYAGLPKSK